ncbi:hypothetical protein [Rufibacter sp. XAAS-G3-1]|uniref:hypothetical protein n=1 Tax=Rufibacter sp. XAAS-G3-1 TaxID=2729134 RepID=UPI0015E66273|nr:hypothetical protein [Rufibacter sp. XAAS-G3-1]
MHLNKPNDAAFNYEDLARAAFDCNSKYCDPFGYAAQDIFGGFVHENNPEKFFSSQRALTTVLTVLVYRFPKTEHTEQLRKLIDRTWEAKTQREAIDIIDEAIEIANQLGL